MFYVIVDLILLNDECKFKGFKLKEKQKCP